MKKPNPIRLRDYEDHAKAMCSPDIWAYLNGAAADGFCHEENLNSWTNIKLLPRVLRHCAGGHTQSELLGRTLRHPIMLAPVASLLLAHPDGELGVAYAAAAQQAGLILSSQASTKLEDVARAIKDEPERGPMWMQLYLQTDRALTLDLVQRAEAIGYEAIVLTVDAPVQGVRDAERQTQFRVPDYAKAINIQETTPPPTQPHINSHLFDDLLRHAPVWDDLCWLQSKTKLPILLKGVLHPEDAQQAQAMGMAGVIVSNHGGRTLDTSVSTAWALPRVVQAVGPTWPVLVDGGIRRGTDVLKALAMGAHAVLIGRPYVHGLTTSGATGVAHVIRLLRDEFEIAMALTGCKTLTDINKDLLIPQVI